MFRPKLFDTLKSYNREQFQKDLSSGIVVGIVALPLAIAFAIASGVSPEAGLITGVVAGFIVSAFGGSRVQIGGPTGAFIVIVYGIVAEYGIAGLTVATLLAGIMLMVMGFVRLGNVIKVIPHPLIVGFTSGIAVIIFTSQIRDFLGLAVQQMPVDFIDKWRVLFANIYGVNFNAVAISVGTVACILLLRRWRPALPGSLIAILLFTIPAVVFHLPVETIGSRFGEIKAGLSFPDLPEITWPLVQTMIKPAFTIALLAGIESLLSAVVADGMIGGNHRSNMELVAQGGANVASALFGGIPATGAIARTITNINNGGRTPVAGIVHSVILFIIMLAASSLISFIPLASLAGILVLVAYNMSEWKTFISVLRQNRADAAVLLVTFLLTVFFDLTIALEMGMLLAVLLFFQRMINVSNVREILLTEENDELAEKENMVPDSTQLFELSGPFFFGAAYKFKDVIRSLNKKPAVLIIRMRHVPVIDATGIHVLQDVLKFCRSEHIVLYLTEIQPAVLEDLRQSRLLFRIGKRYVVPDLITVFARINKSRQVA